MPLVWSSAHCALFKAVWGVPPTTVWYSKTWSTSCDGITYSFRPTPDHSSFSYHRRIIFRKDDRADRLVRWYLSWFSLSKVIQFSKSFSKENNDSITKPPTEGVGILRVTKSKESFSHFTRSTSLGLPPFQLNKEWRGNPLGNPYQMLT